MPPRQGVHVFSARLSIIESSPRRAHRSISPNTMSRELFCRHASSERKQENENNRACSREYRQAFEDIVGRVSQKSAAPIYGVTRRVAVDYAARLTSSASLDWKLTRRPAFGWECSWNRECSAGLIIGQAPQNRRGKPCRPSMFRITRVSCSTHKVSRQSLKLRKTHPPSKRRAMPSRLRRGDASKRH